MITYFFRSWIDSLKLLFSKLFVLVTLKSIFNTYKRLFLYWGWFFILGLLVELLVKPNIKILAWGDWSDIVVEMIPDVLWIIWIFAAILCARPSAKIKDVSYYAHALPLLGYVLAFFALIEGIIWGVTHIKEESVKMGLALVYTAFSMPGIFLPYFFAPLFVFFVLFTVDSDHSILSAIKSFGRALRMVLYNYPWCLIVTALCMALTYIPLQYGFYTLPKHSLHAIIMLFAPIPVVIFTNFYVKRLHDQFTLYFPKSVK